MAQLSVVIPVYNVVQYLDACLQSIVTQSLSDLEILLVDDGSTDGSAALCDDWAQKDSRIRVIHQVNAGPTAACLAGVGQATAEWIAMPDSDDELAGPEVYREMFDMLMDHHADGIQCSYRAVGWGVNAPAGKDGSGTAVFANTGDLPLRVMYPTQTQRAADGCWDPSRCTKLFRRDFLLRALSKVPRDMRYGEDFVMQIHYLAQCRSVVMMNDLIGYHYIRRAGSLSNIADPAQELTRKIQVQESCADVLAGYISSFDRHAFWADRYWEFFQNLLVPRQNFSLGNYIRTARLICLPDYRADLWQLWQEVNPAPSRIGRFAYRQIIFGHPAVGAALLKTIGKIKGW